MYNTTNLNLSSTCELTRSQKKGFTLAEILIVLTVIGVVAALTIPTLLQNTNQAELKAGLKRGFADLQQATLQIKNDNGGSLANAFRNGAGGALDTENFKNALKSKLSIIKDCSGTTSFGGTGGGASAEGCWHGVSSGDFKLLNGTLIGDRPYPGLILSNGALIEMDIISSSCTDNLSAQGGTYTRCGWLDIDVNGFKKPNTHGKDIFTFSIAADSLIPGGAQGFYTPETDCVEGSPTSNGYGCTALYLYQ